MKRLDWPYWLAMAAIVLMLAFAMAAGAAQAPEQGVFQPRQTGIGFWQFIGILLTPGALAVTANIITIRYQRAFAIMDGVPMGKRQIFRRTLMFGAGWGLVAQGSLQGVIHYLTGMPIMWELFLAAVAFTGIASIAVYEAARWHAAKKIKAGHSGWKPFYEWLSVKGVEPDNDTGDDIGPLTRFMHDDSEDTTDPKDQ